MRLGELEAEVSAAGAELRTLRHRGTDLLWDGGPLWPRRAPLLFPIVGGLKADTLQHGGRDFPLPKHGFARDRTFAWSGRTPASCALELAEDADTLAAYPFAFRLRVGYRLEAGALHTELALTNPGEVPLPASLGGHPAFRWPLAPGLPKATHRVVFAEDEPDPIRRLDARGLLAPDPRPTPVRGRILDLHEGLFADDALILDRVRSRSLRFEARGGPALEVAWEGFPHLGLWAKPEPGPSFLCLEPWQGFASPADWDGEFTTKPGLVTLAPGETRSWRYTLKPE
ncbi:aldose 1-epimerase [Geothrix rubra]|uniref:Aldose 1-epimerase n=2 Tax=Geothrix rubra TaxID=2927977 RepID=A0ABQ5Q8X6_9BACT|nr:aldose 1-epimerase [Geothrix rubra]